MKYDNFVAGLPSRFKYLISTFLIVLSIGYFSGLFFVNETTQINNQGIVENYNGNEDDEDAEVMKFRKSKYEIFNIIHTHILSMSLIFFLLAVLMGGATCNRKLKVTLMIEPLLSVLVTFGGIFLIWNGVEWMSYVVMISGALMTLSFVSSVVIIIWSLFFSPENK